MDKKVKDEFKKAIQVAKDRGEIIEKLQHENNLLKKKLKKKK